MSNIITNQELDSLKNYLRINFTDDDEFLTNIIPIAKSYILNYTGLTEVEASSIKELEICKLMLCSEMYENRSIVIKDTEINPVFKMLLDIHCNNFM